MTEKTTTIRRIGFGVTVAVMILALLPFFVALLQERSFIRQEAAFIGRIHEKLPEQEAMVLEILYDTDYTADEVSLGQETLVNNGYTRTGLEILKDRLRAAGEGAFAFLPVILAAAALLFLLSRLSELYAVNVPPGKKRSVS